MLLEQEKDLIAKIEKLEERLAVQEYKVATRMKFIMRLAVLVLSLVFSGGSSATIFSESLLEDYFLRKLTRNDAEQAELN
jgi:hypothetical protein